MKKTTILHAINEMPKEFKLDELLDKLIVIEKIDKGLNDLKEGKTVAHKNVKKMVAKWAK